MVGLLHDLDFEQWPQEHCVKSQELMRQAGVDEAIIHATACHGWGLCVDIKPEHEMEKVLFAADELTGLIGAAALLTGLGWFDKLAKRAGAGTLVPIIGFANAMVSPALEFKTEGLVAGTAAKLFTVAGPVLVFGISASVVYGLVYYFLL